MATNDAATQPINVDLSSDEQGNFSFEIDKSLSPGQHVITVQDENGNYDDAVLYVTEEKPAPPIINTVTNIIPNNFFWAILVLFLLILALIADLLHLAKKADDPEDQTFETTHRYHFTINAIIFSAIILVVVFFTGVYLNRETNFLAGMVHDTASEQGKNVKVSGKMTDPITLKGVKGIDLVSLNTSIRTTESGQYIFGSVNTLKGIRATYPNLIRALVYLPDKGSSDQRMDIYFNADMYNLLVQVADLEMRGIYSDVYTYLAPEIKERVAMERFMEENSTIFTSKNIAEQEIFITGTQLIDNYTVDKYGLKFNKVVQINVHANGKVAAYYFVHNPEGWKLIK